MKLSDLEYPFRLCVELLHFAAFSCKQTQELTSTDIKALVGNFFTQAEIDRAVAILIGESPAPHKGENVVISNDHHQKCSICKRTLTIEDIEYFDGTCNKCEERHVQIMEDELRNDEPATANPMIAEALAVGEDTTGLCTVRELAEMLVASSRGATVWDSTLFGDTRPRVEMEFAHNGRHYNVLTIVTNVEDLPTEEDIALQQGYDAAKEEGSTTMREPGDYKVRTFTDLREETATWDGERWTGIDGGRTVLAVAIKKTN